MRFPLRHFVCFDSLRTSMKSSWLRMKDLWPWSMSRPGTQSVLSSSKKSHRSSRAAGTRHHPRSLNSLLSVASSVDSFLLSCFLFNNIAHLSQGISVISPFGEVRTKRTCSKSKNFLLKHCLFLKSPIKSCLNSRNANSNLIYGSFHQSTVWHHCVR